MATTNEGKAREWNEISRALASGAAPQFTCVEEKSPLLEIQDIDPVQVALVKAWHAAKVYKKPVLIEDVSFGIDALGGFPGALYAPVEKGFKPKGILDMALQGCNLQVASTEDSVILLRNPPRATVTEVIAFLNNDGTTVSVVKVEVHGSMPPTPRGTGGFGFDPIFIPDGPNLTYAEMSPEQKNACSMRFMAIRKLLAGDSETHQLPPMLDCLL
ncbi:MAG TPA: non-canonical purine NTP pyrophosphatase [Candidatus Peribacteraceae bacterium]|nr:non-canonical purine NTP pyrophosphatase [Candidatus Peribacteraceae bacterium]